MSYNHSMHSGRKPKPKRFHRNYSVNAGNRVDPREMVWHHWPIRFPNLCWTHWRWFLNAKTKYVSKLVRLYDHE